MRDRSDFSDIVAHYDDGNGHVVVIDAATMQILDLSADAPGAIGMERADLLGMGGLDLAHPDDQLRAAEAVLELVEHEGPRPPGMYRIRTADGYQAFAVSAVPVDADGHPLLVYIMKALDERHRAEALAADQVEIMEMRTDREPIDACLAALVRMAERHADGLTCAITVLGPKHSRSERGFVVAGGGIDPTFIARRRLTTLDSLPPAVRSSHERGLAALVIPEEDSEPFNDVRHHRFGRCIVSPLIGRDGELLGFIEGFDESVSTPNQSEWSLQSLVARLASLFLDQVRFEQQLEAAANTDSLTGLANRRKLNAELDRLASSNRSYAVAMVDLDQFSWINNNFGHQEGDRLLVEAATRLERALDVRSIVARPAGDEFVVCIPNVTDRFEALRLGTMIHEVLQRPVEGAHTSPGLRHRGIRASVGVALAEAGEPAERVLSAADAAMYVAKRAGGDAVHCPESGAEGSARHRHDIRRSLAKAIEEDGLHLVMQPLVDLENGELHSVELLVRWEVNHQIIATPDEFVAVAEETDLILALDEWVLAEAGRMVAALTERGLLPEGGRVWANVSPRSVQQPGLTSMLLALVGADLAPRFGIEVTERQVETDAELMAENLAEARAAGFAVALDDFGTGFGSLLQLAELPATDLKIDGTFVARMLNQPVYATLVEATIQLARSLRMSVTAEAIESADQWRRLSDLGCDLGQGFYFAAPMPLDQLVGWVESSGFEARLAELNDRG